VHQIEVFLLAGAMNRGQLLLLDAIEESLFLETGQDIFRVLFFLSIGEVVNGLRGIMKESEPHPVVDEVKEQP